MFWGSFPPIPCNSHDNWASNDYHKVLKIHFSRPVLGTSGAVCGMSLSWGDSPWLPVCWEQVCCQQGFLWGTGSVPAQHCHGFVSPQAGKHTWNQPRLSFVTVRRPGWKLPWNDGHALWSALGSGGLGMRGSGTYSLQQLPMHSSWGYFGFWHNWNTKYGDFVPQPQLWGWQRVNGDTGGALQLLLAQGQTPRSSGMVIRAGERDTIAYGPRNHFRGLKMLKTWVKAYRNESLAI